jgi:hypothetical protein
MSESTSLKSIDLLAVKSRVSWAAIAAGAMIALAVYFVLTLVGIAIGLELAVRRNSVDLGVGAAIWSIASLLLAMFFGGWATSRLAVGESKLEAVLYGVILWGVLFVGMFWLIGQGVRVGFGLMMGVASGAVVVTDEDPAEAASAGAPATLIQRYNSTFGGEKFVEDLTKIGVDRERAEKIRDMAKQKLDAIQNDPTPIPAQIDTAAHDPNVRQTAREVANGTRKAVWYTLAGVMISMVSVILGSLAGSGVLPIPVPLQGVRRPTNPPRA